MLVREPLIYATYYYLRDLPDDSPARRDERHAAFVADTHTMIRSVAGWLAMDTPDLPAIPVWTLEPPADIQPLAKTSQMVGRTNASAWVGAYALRDMLLLRVVIVRNGEHDPDTWSLLSEALGSAPATPSWLDTRLYWCGMAPRLPEAMEDGRLLPVQTPYGLLSLAQSAPAHVLIYPDARTETRANAFLRALAPRLDWHPVQARYRMEQYDRHASRAMQAQQRALEQVDRTVQAWPLRDDRRGLRALAPLNLELTTLETTYATVVADLDTTQRAAQGMQALAASYRRALLTSGLWDAAPSLWQAQIVDLDTMRARIEADVSHLEGTLRRIENLQHGVEMRLSLLQHERERWLSLLIGGLGLALLAVLVIDTDPVRVAVRLLALLVVAALAWGVWRKLRLPDTPPGGDASEQ